MHPDGIRVKALDWRGHKFNSCTFNDAQQVAQYVPL